MKELFSRTFKYFKRDISVWILGIIIYALIMTICISLSLLIGIFDILAIFFVSMPFLISFILMAWKSNDALSLSNEDIYLGYKNMSFNISIAIKKLAPAMLFTLLFYFGIQVVLIFFDFIFIDQNIFIEYIKFSKDASIEEAYTWLLSQETLLSHLRIVSYVSIALSLVFINVIANKKIFSIIFLYRLKNPRFNYDYIVRNKKELKSHKLYLYNGIISLFYVVGVIVAILLSLVLNKVIDNSVIVYVISALSFFLISSFAIPFKYISYVYLFNKYFEDDFSRLFEDIIKEQ